MNKNSLKDLRESILISKSELARIAGVSPLTIYRIEKGMSCRMATKRKILLALGFDFSERAKIFLVRSESLIHLVKFYTSD